MYHLNCDGMVDIPGYSPSMGYIRGFRSSPCDSLPGTILPSRGDSVLSTILTGVSEFSANINFLSDGRMLGHKLALLIFQIFTHNRLPIPHNAAISP